MSKSFPGAVDTSFERKKGTVPKLLAGCHAVIILHESEQENIPENRRVFSNLKTYDFIKTIRVPSAHLLRI